jgi:hypothetical protein
LAGAMTIILFLIEKTPWTAAILLLLMTGLLVYPVLHFVTRQKVRGMVFACLIIATALLGWMVWPKHYPAESAKAQTPSRVLESIKQDTAQTEKADNPAPPYQPLTKKHKAATSKPDKPIQQAALREPLPQQEANPGSISGTYGGAQITGLIARDSGIGRRTGGSSVPAPENCDMSGAVNYCNSPNSDISNITVRSANPAVNVTNSENTPTSGVDYKQTQPLGGNGPGGPAIGISGGEGAQIENNVTYGCGSLVAATNAPGTRVENSEARLMPPDACELYYGALNLEVGCGGKKDQLIAWEKRIATFWTGENLKQWNEKFGPYDPAAIEAMTVDQMCADVFYHSPKMHFFQRVYYGHEGYQ